MEKIAVRSRLQHQSRAIAIIIMICLKIFYWFSECFQRNFLLVLRMFSTEKQCKAKISTRDLFVDVLSGVNTLTPATSRRTAWWKHFKGCHVLKEAAHSSRNITAVVRLLRPFCGLWMTVLVKVAKTVEIVRWMAREIVRFTGRPSCPSVKRHKLQFCPTWSE